MSSSAWSTKLYILICVYVWSVVDLSSCSFCKAWCHFDPAGRSQSILFLLRWCRPACVFILGFPFLVSWGWLCCSISFFNLIKAQPRQIPADSRKHTVRIVRIINGAFPWKFLSGKSSPSLSRTGEVSAAVSLQVLILRISVRQMLTQQWVRISIAR